MKEMKISHSSQENTCVRVSFLMMFQASGNLRYCCGRGFHTHLGKYTFPTRYVQWFCKIRRGYSIFTVRSFSGVLNAIFSSGSSVFL